MGRRYAGQLGVMATVALLAIVTGCGSDSDSGGQASAGGGSAADTPLKVTAIVDATGIAGFAGSAAQTGIELGVKQLQAEGKKVELTVQDTGSEQTQAVNLLNKAISSDADVVLFGALSSEGLALAPIAQKGKLPFVAMQTGVTGVVENGDYIFRTTTPQQRFFPSLFDYLKEQSVKKISMFYASDSATITELATKVMPPLAEENGMTIASTDTVTSTQTDFKSIASKVAGEKPDAVFAGTQGTQNVTVITQLRRAGYDGIIFNSGGFAGGVLDPLGKNANALVYPVWFAPESNLPVGQKFVTDYKAANGGKTPATFAGEGYDQVQLLKAALGKVSGELTRESFHKALIAATAEGFPATQGEPLKFENRDARGTGFIVRRDNGVDKVVKAPEAG
jgi:branched-chain amino acid transport system substrate-binding protein